MARRNTARASVSSLLGRRHARCVGEADRSDQASSISRTGESSCERDPRWRRPADDDRTRSVDAANAGDRQPTEGHADQPHHQGHDGPELPGL